MSSLATQRAFAMAPPAPAVAVVEAEAEAPSTSPTVSGFGIASSEVSCLVLGCCLQWALTERQSLLSVVVVAVVAVVPVVDLAACS